jgi:tetratricopeptide (TPR) repeat protein
MEQRIARQTRHIYQAVGIFTFALLLRLLHVSLFSSTVFSQNPIHDARFYHDQAVSIASGNWFGHGAFFMGPLYSYFLATMYYISGGSTLLALLIQAVLGAGTCVIVYFIGREVFSNSIGIIAALLTSLYGVLIFYDGLLLMESLTLFLNMLCLLMLLRAGHTGKSAYFLAGGLCLGASALGRPSVLVFGLAAAIVIALSYPSSLRRRVIGAIAFTVAILIMVLPVTIVNYELESDFVLVSTNGGINLYIGNGPGANGTYRILPNSNVAPGDMAGRFVAELVSGRHLTAAETSRWWWKQTTEYMRTHPWLALKNFFWKVYLFWNSYELPQLEWYSATRPYSPILRLPLMTSRLVIPLAILGIIAGARRLRSKLIVPVYLGAETLAISVFFVTGRYRTAILPVLAVYAAYGIAWLLAALRRGLWRRVLFSAVGLAVLFWLTAPARLHLDTDELKKWHNINLGLRYAETHAGLVQALALLKETATEFPEDPDTHEYYGIVLRRADRLEASVAELRAAQALRPGDPVIDFQLGKTFSEIGDDSLAEEYFLRAVSLAPFYKDAYEYLAAQYARQSRYNDALAAYVSAVKIDPTDSSLLLNLGITYGVLGMPTEAVAQLELAVRYDAANWKARYNLAVALAGVGRREDAERELETVLELHPDYEPARRLLKELSLQSPD